MHPDAFEDQTLQRQLVTSCIALNDWSQLHRSLLILTSSDDDQRSRAWNVLLRAYMGTKDWNTINMVVKDMLSSGIFLSEKTIRYSFFQLLRRREKGKRPQALPDPIFVDDLGLLTSMWLQNIRSGGEVDPAFWREVLTRFGMENRYADVQNLALWLAAHYSAKTAPSMSEVQAAVISRYRHAVSARLQRRVARRLQRHFSKRGPLELVFPTQRLCALVHWSFKAIGRPLPKEQRRRLGISDLTWNLDSRPLKRWQRAKDWSEDLERLPIWARGVALLLRLKSYGVPVKIETIRKVCRQRLLVLWGPVRSNDKENRLAHEAVKNNATLLRRMVLVLHKLCGSKLFPDFVRRHSRGWKEQWLQLNEQELLKLVVGRSVLKKTESRRRRMLSSLREKRRKKRALARTIST